MNALSTISTDPRRAETPIVEQLPIPAELDRLADAVSAVTSRLDLLMSRTSPVRSQRPQDAPETANTPAVHSVLGEAIANQTQRLWDIARGLNFILDTMEI